MKNASTFLKQMDFEIACGLVCVFIDFLIYVWGNHMIKPQKLHFDHMFKFPPTQHRRIQIFTDPV